MRLKEILRGAPVVEIIGDDEIDVGQVRDDSRRVQPGDVFVARRGLTVDGHLYVTEADRRGAVACVLERDVPFGGVKVITRDAGRALAVLAANRYQNPGLRMTLVGVTGTNGKTTTTFMVESILRAAGYRPGVIGTINYRYGAVVKAAPYTTPTPVELHRILREMADAGTTHVVMETSSHALELGRLYGLRFRVGAFTNLTQDHLDLHGSMEAYFAAKARLFEELIRPGDGVAVAMVDTPEGDRLLELWPGARLRCSILGAGDVFAERARWSIGGIEARMHTPSGSFEVKSPLLGEFNLANITLATGIAAGLGISLDAIAAGITALAGVPGRLERVDSHGQPVAVVVDYAHTPDALERALGALRSLTAGRLLVVFGCGGDRDRKKRPLMGQAAVRGADVVVVTSDNPRTEAPQSIIDQIVAGVEREPIERMALTALGNVGKGYAVELDRRTAIAAAIRAARAGDIVLIAGKGHEDYQILGKQKIHFDDREEASRVLSGLASFVADGPIVEAGPAVAPMPITAPLLAAAPPATAPGDLDEDAVVVDAAPPLDDDPPTNPRPTRGDGSGKVG
jgi:UDP-N-acetylmuramoyl-L-alanyl-D-glutamate--2,6-diaminopimelate ligase